MTIKQDISSLFKTVHEKGFFHLLSANIFIQIVAFASQLFVAGILMPDDVGRIKIIQTFLSIFSIIGGLGFNGAILKLCSENRDEAETKKLFKTGLFYTFLTTFLSYFIIIILNFTGVLSPDKIVRWIFPLAIFPLITSTLYNSYVSYFQARKNIKLISNITTLNKTFSIIFIIIFTYFWKINGYYIAYNIGFIATLIVVFFVSKSEINIKNITISEIKSFLPQHWKYAKPTLWATLLAEFAAYVDIILLNYFIKDMFEIGFYGFALTLTVMLRILPATVQQISTPYFSSFSDEIEKFKQTYHKYSKLLIAIIIITLIISILIVPPAIHYLFNGKYDKSMIFFIPLAIGWSIRQYNQIQSAALFGLGKINFIAYSQIISLIFNIILLFFTIHFYGIIGASYASIACSAFSVIILNILLRKSIRTTA